MLGAQDVRNPVAAHPSHRSHPSPAGAGRSYGVSMKLVGGRPRVLPGGRETGPCTAHGGVHLAGTWLSLDADTDSGLAGSAYLILPATRVKAGFPTSSHPPKVGLRDLGAT